MAGDEMAVILHTAESLTAEKLRSPIWQPMPKNA
jgi:hypothetical protein